MKLNLTNSIENDKELIREYFKNLDWKCIDTDAFEIPNLHVFVILSQEIIDYSDKTKFKKEVWIKCIVDFNEKNVDEVVNYFLKLFKFSKYKPFKDEDACKLYFTKAFPKYDKDTYRMAFFLNPDYPNGYWDNHAIADITP